MNSKSLPSKIGLTLILCLGFSSLSQAQTIDPAISNRRLSAIEVFSRCYAHLTGVRLPSSHPLRASVNAGTLSPVNACMQVLQSANLNSSGTVASTTTVGSLNQSLAVLRTLNDYHITLTANPDLNNSIPSAVYTYGTRIIHDEGEFGLHFTRSLFFPGARVSDIVTASLPVEAIRSSGGQSSFRTSVGTSALPTVETGSFLGVRSMPSSKTSITRSIGDGDGRNYTTDIFRSAGGGILGTQPYLSSNFGRSYMQVSDGGNSIPRRWARAVYQDLLCRPIPVVRPSDANAFVVTNPTSSTPGFRRSASCMQCHSSIDPMGITARNYMLIGNDYDTGAMHLHRWAVTQPAETGTPDRDSVFHQRPPNGRLYFRSYNGTLVDRSVTGIADLGTKISETDDYYACVASKYFYFFTGIKVNLQDSGDSSLPPLSSADIAYRNSVIQMGQSLKSHQNLQTLIRDILSSSHYQTQSNRMASP